MINFSSANITKCHFYSNHAPGDGGAIYVTMKSKLRVFDSEFEQNRATNGGSLGVHVSDCVIESSDFTSDNASHYGGCVSMIAANVTITRSNLSGCESKVGGSVSIQHSTLKLEEVTISNSSTTGSIHFDSLYYDHGGALYVGDNSDLFLKDSILTGCHSDMSAGGIYCSGSRVYMESLLVSSCSSRSSLTVGCVFSYRCTSTMDNVTFVDTHDAIYAAGSTINIYNSFVQNDVHYFFEGSSSHITFWNLKISGPRINLFDSVTEFRHTTFVNVDHGCLVEGWFRSSIELKSVYLIGPSNMSQSEDRIVCKRYRVKVHGNVSGNPSVQNSF